VQPIRYIDDLGCQRTLCHSLASISLGKRAKTFILAKHLPGYRPFDDTFNYCFNSYYESQGPRQPRPRRGVLTRPSSERVLAYRAHVDEALAKLFAQVDSPEPEIARRPSGVTARAVTQSVWPWSVRSGCPLAASHSRIVWSALAEARVFPSGLQATLVTADLDSRAPPVTEMDSRSEHWTAGADSLRVGARVGMTVTMKSSHGLSPSATTLGEPMG